MLQHINNADMEKKSKKLTEEIHWTPQEAEMH